MTGVLLHLADRAEWADAGRDSEYRPSSRGVSLDDVGFIHCCGPDQLAGVGQRHYANVDPTTLVVLVVDADRLDAPVHFESAVPGGEAFPHVYGPIPVAAVVQTLDVYRGPAGVLIVTSPAPDPAS